MSREDGVTTEIERGVRKIAISSEREAVRCRGHRGRGGLCPYWARGTCLYAPEECYRDHPEAEGTVMWREKKWSGWVYGADLGGEGGISEREALAYRRVAVIALNKLREKLKNSGIAELQYQNGHSGALLWTAVSTDSDLPGAVYGVRRLVEVLLYFQTDASVDGPSALLRGEDRERRWRLICRHAWKLSRSDERGPDAPLHWSAHNHRNHYRYTVVNRRTLLEVVGRLAIIVDALLLEGSAGNKSSDDCHYTCEAVHEAFRNALNAPPTDPDDQNVRKNQRCDYPTTVFEAKLRVLLKKR